MNNLWLKEGGKSVLSADSKSTDLPSLGTEKIQYPNAVSGKKKSPFLSKHAFENKEFHSSGDDGWLKCNYNVS